MPLSSASLPRIIPFALFMAFIAAEEIVRIAAGIAEFTIPPKLPLYLYPLRAVSGIIALWYFRGSYDEIVIRDLKNMKQLMLSSITGVLVFIIWINLQWTIPGLVASGGSNPTLINDYGLQFLLVSTRLLGAVMLVPIIEELFWRSFLARSLVSKKFMDLPIGTFTPFSFMASALLFGLEHNLVLAGIAAGICYNFLLHRTKSIIHCIVAHAITNLLLGIHVLSTGSWHLW